VSSAATAPEGAAPGAGPAPSRPSTTIRPSPGLLAGLVLAAAAVALAFTTTGGLDDVAGAGDTWSEIAITVLGAVACGAVVLLSRRGRAWGGATVGLFAAVTVFTALSIAWSVAPDDSWQSASQTVGYLGAFAAAAALARLAPRRWPAVVGAVATAAVALSAYTLLAKALPGTLDPRDEIGRLQVPFGYWNAIGVVAALGLAPCLWAGTRLAGGRLLRALSAPGLALLISVVALSYSRSAALIAVLGVAAWVAVVPLRLRTAALLALASVGAAVIISWALSTPALTADRCGRPTFTSGCEAARVSAGYTFGLVLLVTLMVLMGAGFAWAMAVERVRLVPGTRRQIGTVLVVLTALVPLAGIGALIASSRGLTGEISHEWTTLTSTSGSGVVVGDNAGRLLQFGSSRPLYWSEGITVGEHFLLAGAGAEAFAVAHTAYTDSAAPLSHVHSYAIQTFADLGLIGIAINLALLISWALAASRPLALRSSPSSLSMDQAAERQGLLALAIVVVAFGAQSAVDWTWFFSGVAVPALVCAGWLAGRGPLADPVGRARDRRPVMQRPGAGALITALVAVTLLCAWAIWQPLRSADALSNSLDAVASNHSGQAFTDARDAADIDPVTIEPLQILSELYGARDPGAARRELVQATRRQPDNPEPWSWLGQFDLLRHHNRLAYASLDRELALDRENVTLANTVISLRTALGIPPPKS
jgi:hypothetical protein